MDKSVLIVESWPTKRTPTVSQVRVLSLGSQPTKTWQLRPLWAFELGSEEIRMSVAWQQKSAQKHTLLLIARYCECLPLFWASCFLHIWLLMFVVSCWSACYSKSARRTKTAQTRCWSHSLAPAHHAAGSRGWSSCKTSGSKSTFHSTSIVFFSTELIHSPISMFCLSSAQVCSCCDLHLSESFCFTLIDQLQLGRSGHPTFSRVLSKHGV